MSLDSHRLGVGLFWAKLSKLVKILFTGKIEHQYVKEPN